MKKKKKKKNNFNELEHETAHCMHEKFDLWYLSEFFLFFEMYRLFNVLCWLWNIYEGAELPSVCFITNTKTLYNLFSPDPAVSCVVSHPEMYTV